MDFLRSKKLGLGLDMAPLIDVVFQLLIFFLLTSSFSQPALKLTLPKAAARDLKQPDEIVVSIDKKGDIWVNSQRVSLEGLEPLLETRLNQASQKAIHLRADREMPYGNFVRVMDLARQAGAEQIHIIHEGDRDRE